MLKFRLPAGRRIALRWFADSAKKERYFCGKRPRKPGVGFFVCLFAPKIQAFLTFTCWVFVVNFIPLAFFPVPPGGTPSIFNSN
jgi:hypothetical protein